MRIAFLMQDTVNAAYRCAAPMEALARRGHEVRQLDLAAPAAWRGLVRWCDVLYVHRICDGGVLELARASRAGGAAVVWDDDDDVTSVAKDSEAYRSYSGLAGQRYLAARRRLFELVALVTTPSRWLASAFSAAGAPRVQVIENYLIDPFAHTPSRRADGVTIGWTAGVEHRADLARIPIRDALTRLLAAHPGVRAQTLGTTLGFEHERYLHSTGVPLPQLPVATASFDIGIAPLSSELPLNRARSNVKLKEYAAMGIPWLASPVGPYLGMGEREGGRLVPDDRWYEELEALVTNARARRKLAKRARRWGSRQTIARNAGQWEQAFAAAVQHARAA